MSEQNTRKHGFDTLALHAGQNPDPLIGTRAVPIYQTTSFALGDTQRAARLFSLEEAGYDPVRLSIGLEDKSGLLYYLDRALQESQN